MHDAMYSDGSQSCEIRGHADGAVYAVFNEDNGCGVTDWVKCRMYQMPSRETIGCENPGLRYEMCIFSLADDINDQ